VLTPRAVGGAGPGFGDLIYTEATGKTKSGTGTSCAAPARKGCTIYRTSVSNSSKSLSSGTTTPSDYPTASGKNCANNSKRPWPTTKPARANYTRALTRRLKKLDERESRLIDLAADAALPLGQDTPVTAELSQVSKEFRDDYESDRALNLNIERLCLPTLCTPLRSASQPSSARDVESRTRSPAQQGSSTDIKVPEKWS